MDHQTLLNTLVEDATAYSDNATRQAAYRAAIGRHPHIDLVAVETAAVTEFDKLHSQDDAKPGALDKLRRFVDVIHAVRAEKQARSTAPESGQDKAPAATTPATPAAAAGTQAPAAPASTAVTTAPAPQEAPGMDTATAPLGTEVVTASGTQVTVLEK